ncbi:MAG: hypothetical protein ACXW11_03530 [Methylotenera sp.]
MPILRFDTPEGIHSVLTFIVNSKVVEKWDCKSIQRRIDIAIVGVSGTPVRISVKTTTNYDSNQPLIAAKIRQ